MSGRVSGEESLVDVGKSGLKSQFGRWACGEMV